MTCQQVDSEEIAERYLRGELSPAGQDAYERHFFACPHCLEKLEILQALPAAFAGANVTGSQPYKTWALAACLLVAAGAGLVWTITSASPSPQSTTATEPTAKPPDPLAELARFEPPSYEQPVTRGTRSEAARAFQAGMALYRTGAFAEAIPKLDAAAKLNRQDPGPRFFAGICRLVAGDAVAGIADLRSVDAMGLTPYQEEARYYLAKGLLRQRDVAGARAALLGVVGMNGDLAQQARAMLDRLRTVTQATEQEN
jgi:hypothetical protein